MSQQECQTTAIIPPVNTSSNPLQPQALMAGKTPIQVLHEYGIKIGQLPVYTMERAEGEAHIPSFIFTVTIGELTCSGQGPTKQAAKHQAAEAALSSLPLQARMADLHIKGENNVEEGDGNDLTNLVGKLQELTLQRGWRPPEYHLLSEVGPPHNRQFTITCCMETLSETAIGSSKKVAKKAAAEKMMATLQSLSGGSEITWTPKPSVRMENLRISTGEQISLLRSRPLSVPNTDYVQILSDLCREQGMEASYIDIDELTVNGQYQCLVELSTCPVTVCRGTGISCSNAHNDAAYSALQYVKMMASIQ